MFCENCGHQISDTAKFCSACGHPVGTAPSPGVGAPPTVPAKRESPRLKASSGNGSISRMSGIRRKPWILRMPIPDPHTGITVMKTVGTYVTREEAEAVRAEMMKRPATPYQDYTLAKIHEIFLESREYKGRSDKARELYDLAWKYLKPLWYYKIAALYAQDFQNILDKMADDGLSQSMLEKERTLICAVPLFQSSSSDLAADYNVSLCDQNGNPAAYGASHGDEVSLHSLQLQRNHRMQAEAVCGHIHQMLSGCPKDPFRPD